MSDECDEYREVEALDRILAAQGVLDAVAWAQIGTRRAALPPPWSPCAMPAPCTKPRVPGQAMTQRQQTSREAPADVVAERSVLGAMLSPRTDLPTIREVVRSEHFYRPGFQTVFTAISRWTMLATDRTPSWSLTH